MVWGGTFLEGRTILHILGNGTLTVDRYWDDILKTIVRLYAGAVDPGFLLEHDNASRHVARAHWQLLDEEEIDAIDWPSRSTNLNPIENLWDVMYWSIWSSQDCPGAH